MKEKRKGIDPAIIRNMQGALYKAFEQSLYRQSIRPKDIAKQAHESEREEWLNKETLYRYYDHAERGQRYLKRLRNTLDSQPPPTANAKEWEDYVLELSDWLAGIIVSWHAVEEFNKESYPLSGTVNHLTADKALEEIRDGVVHVRDGKAIASLVTLNRKSTSGGVGFPSGELAHSVWSPRVIDGYTKIVWDNFINCEETFFDKVIAEIDKLDPGLLSFEPYITRKSDT